MTPIDAVTWDNKDGTRPDCNRNGPLTHPLDYTEEGLRVSVSATITQLRSGDQVPPWPPRRYRAGHGYIRLRWKIAPGRYVEAYEHRVIDGRVTTAEHVHHRNHVRDDNRPENLEHLTAEEHFQEHTAADKARARQAARLYRDGLTTIQVAEEIGVGAPCVSRMLQRQNVATRSKSHYAKPLDEDDIVRRYLAGQGIRRIKTDLHISPDRIKAVLLARGITLRGPGRVPAWAVAS